MDRARTRELDTCIRRHCVSYRSRIWNLHLLAKKFTVNVLYLCGGGTSEKGWAGDVVGKLRGLAHVSK